MLEPASERGCGSEAHTGTAPGVLLPGRCWGWLGWKEQGLSSGERRCFLGWVIPSSRGSSLLEQAITAPVRVSVSPPCWQTCFVITFLQHWEPSPAISRWIALCCVCHRFGDGFLLLGIPEASLLLESWSLLSSPCSAWHCWGDRSCCSVPHVGGLFSPQRSGFCFLHLPTFATGLFFDAGGRLKSSMLFPACWNLRGAAKGCRGGCRLYCVPSAREQPR